ncbi:phosphohistidine phosphatase SixA [bacterium]|nr:phosphohistidine phosphatase SixA [bacterium]
MIAYFVQHGLAMTKEEGPSRRLSQDGRKEVECMARYLRKQDLAIREVYHSGKTRAKETAQIFAEQLGNCGIRELSGMSPNDDVRGFASTLKFDNTMYVGHLPHLGKAISYLITGNENQNLVKLANSGVVCVEKGSAGVYIDGF